MAGMDFLFLAAGAVAFFYFDPLHLFGPKGNTGPADKITSPVGFGKGWRAEVDKLKGPAQPAKAAGLAQSWYYPLDDLRLTVG